MIKPLEEINKLIISRKTIMVSYVVIGATSLPMYSGKPVIGSGDCHPCRGFHIFILAQFSTADNTPHHHSKILIYHENMVNIIEKSECPQDVV